MINLIFVSFCAVQIYMTFIYSFVFFTFYGYITNSKWPAPSWLDSSVGRELHRFRRGHVFESNSGQNFFRLKFHNCWSCVHNRDDQSYLHIILRFSNVWTFIYSFVEKHPCIVFQSQVSRKKVLLGNQILPFCVSNVSFTLTRLFLLMFLLLSPDCLCEWNL